MTGPNYGQATRSGTPAFPAASRKNRYFPAILVSASLPFQPEFGPQGAGGIVLQVSRGIFFESGKASEGTPSLGAFAPGNSCFCPDQGRRWQGIAGVCHGFERVGRWSSTCREALIAALLAGFAGDPQCAPSRNSGFADGYPKPACPQRLDHPRRWVSTGWPEVFTCFAG